MRSDLPTAVASPSIALSWNNWRICLGSISAGCTPLSTALSPPTRRGAIAALAELLSQCLARIAASGGRGHGAAAVVAEEAGMLRRLAGADPARWACLHRDIDENFAAVRELNLDRKQAMLGAFFAIAEAAR